MMKLSFTKKIRILLGILILLGSFFFPFPPNQASAQSAGTACTTEGGASGYWRYVAGTLTCDTSLAGSLVGSNVTRAAKTIDDSAWAVTVLKSGMMALANIILQMVGSLLALAGILLNGAVEISVQKMSVFVNNTPAITTAWTVIRDVSNIIILFILLFSAIGTILRTDQLVPKSSLAKIIIAALLINFSMFFTKVIIDVSNVATLAIYNEIASADQTRPANPGGVELYGISGAFMQGLQLQTSYKKILAESKNPNFETHIFQQMIFGIIIILIATFVLLTAAIMLIVRFGILIMLLITSPIGLVGGLIPKMAKYKDQWWSTLLGQAFFAPVLLLFLLISVSIIKSINASATLHLDLGTQTGVGAVFNFFGGGIAMAIQYCLTIFFLIFSITIAKSIAGSAGAGVTKWASQKAGSLAFGTTAAVGQRTIGRFGASFSDENSRLGRFAKGMAASNSLISKSIGTGLIAGGDKFKKASFDIRNVGAVNGLDAGKGTKGGYEGWFKEQKKKEEEREKNIGGENRQTQAAVREATKRELVAKETLRRIPLSDANARREAEYTLMQASKRKKELEDQSKVERAESRLNVGQREQQFARTAQGLTKLESLWTTVVNPANRAAAKTLEDNARKELNKLNKDKNKKRVEEIKAEKEKLQTKAQEWGVEYKKDDDEIVVKEELPGSKTLQENYERLKREEQVLTKSVKSAEEEEAKKKAKETLEGAIKGIEEDKPQKEKKGDDGATRPEGGGEGEDKKE